jgi:hypothetical protein
MPVYAYVFIAVAVVSVAMTVHSYLKVLRLRRRRQWREHLIDAMCTPLSSVPTMVSEAKDESGERYTTLPTSGELFTDVILLGMQAKGTFTVLCAFVEHEDGVTTFANVKDVTLDVSGRITPVFLPAGTRVSVTLEGTGEFDLLGYEVPAGMGEDVRELLSFMAEHLRPAEVTPGPPLS